MSDRGTAAVAMCALVACVLILTVAITALATLYAARAQTTNAADAAALAAAVATYPPAASGAPTDAARQAARANGAELVTCRCLIDLTLRPRTVEVVAGTEVDVPIFGVIIVRSASRAEFDPTLWLAG